MIEDYFTARCCLRRLRRGPMASHIDGLTASLRERGYTRRTIRWIVCLTGKFSRYAEAAGVDSASDVDDRLVARFLHELPARRFRDARQAMHHMLDLLRRQGVIREMAQKADAQHAPFAPMLARYDHYLTLVRSLPVTTRRDYCRGARRLLLWLRQHRRARDPGRLRGADVITFISDQAAAYPSAAWRNRLTSQTRLFLRFLQWEGIIDADLTRVVPKLPHWRLASIPRHLPWERVRALIDSIDTRTPWGLRDRAVLLLIAMLGIRGAEVRRLLLTDIAWRSSEIHLPQTKTYRARVLPLPHEVGAALSDYILHGRPRVRAPQVILRHDAPIGPLSSPSAVGRIVTRNLRRAAIVAPARSGTHMLRHSLATRLVNRGVPIKQIADLLGHCSIDTTAIYSKVDVTQLTAVALPLPADA
jgi:integrase/recombinase XerD